MKFCSIDSYQAMLQLPTKQLESKIRDYLIYPREDKKVTGSNHLAISGSHHPLLRDERSADKLEKAKQVQGQIKRCG